MKTIDKLVLADRNLKLNNHRVYFPAVNMRHFIYHSTIICCVNDDVKTIMFDNGGYNTVSTKRAINAYKAYFVNQLGYTVIDDDYYNKWLKSVK